MTTSDNDVLFQPLKIGPLELPNRILTTTTMNGGGIGDSNPVELFSQVALTLSKYDLAYVHTAEAIKPGPIYNADVDRVTPYIRRHYRGVFMTNGGYDKRTAAEAIRSGEADAITFGRMFLANPDLPERLRRDSALNAPDADTFYSAGPAGYVDYPVMSQAVQAF